MKKKTPWKIIQINSAGALTRCFMPFGLNTNIVQEWDSVEKHTSNMLALFLHSRRCRPGILFKWGHTDETANAKYKESRARLTDRTIKARVARMDSPVSLSWVFLTLFISGNYKWALQKAISFSLYLQDVTGARETSVFLPSDIYSPHSPVLLPHPFSLKTWCHLNENPFN